MPGSLSFDSLDLKKGVRFNLHIYIGSALSKFMAVSLPPSLKNEKEQQLAAQAQMVNQLGLNPSEWQFSMDLVRQPDKSVVCAIRRNVIERIRMLADENDLRLVSLKPYVVGVWNAMDAYRQGASESRSALMAVESDAFTLLVNRFGKVESASTLLHHCEGGLIDREIRRLGFSLDAGEEQSIHLAVTDELLNLAQANTGKILSKNAFLKNEIYADFRDLLFASEASAQ